MASDIENDALGPLVIATVASSVADELWEDYRAAFEALGVPVVHLDVSHRWDFLGARAARPPRRAPCPCAASALLVQHAVEAPSGRRFDLLARRFVDPA